MSYHAVENLVEDAVHLIAESKLPVEEQRKLIYNLYRFQNKFDTGYTVLRCFSFLENIAFLKKLPLDQHPDFKKDPDYFSNLEESNWIHADVDLADDGDVVYYENGFIFPEYGSQLWERLVKVGKWKEAIEKPQNIPVLRLTVDIIALAEKHGDTLLMHNFFLAFLNAYLEFDIDSTDGIPERFEDWINHPELLQLRELFIRHSLLQIKKKEADFNIPSRSTELTLDSDPARLAKVDFLMNAKKTVEKIYQSYLKAQKALKGMVSKVEAIGDLVKMELEKREWIFVSEVEEQNSKTFKWLWYRDVPSTRHTNRIFTEIILEVEHRALLAKKYVQHGLLLEWQEKPLTKSVTDAHFETNHIELIDDEEVEENLNFFGLWVLPLKSKQNVLDKSVILFLDYIDPLDAIYLEKVNATFPEPFFSKPYASYVDIFESDEPISDFLLISNLYSVSLLFIHKLVQEGKIAEALLINDTQESRLTNTFRKNITWYQESYVPYIEAIKNGQKPALPQLFRRG
jgi:hypothetical protein